LGVFLYVPEKENDRGVGGGGSSEKWHTHETEFDPCKLRPIDEGGASYGVFLLGAQKTRRGVGQLSLYVD